jgi:hypothetical protein
VRRETKLNLLFLALFLAASLPGGVILFRKKLLPGARPIFMSDTIDRRVPYMSPGNPPPGYRRVIPPLTAQWLDQLVHERTGEPRALMNSDARGNNQPILSDDHQLQLLSIRRTDNQTHLAVIDWNPAHAPDRAAITASLRSGQTLAPAAVQAIAQINLPPAVKTELINLGLMKVPASIAWIDISAAPAITESTELLLISSAAPGQASRVIRLPPLKAR